MEDNYYQSYATTFIFVYYTIHSMEVEVITLYCILDVILMGDLNQTPISSAKWTTNTKIACN